MRGDKIVKQNKKRIYGGLLAVVMTLLLGGCTFSQNKTEKIRDLEYIGSNGDIYEVNYNIDIVSDHINDIPIGLGKPMLALCQLLVCREVYRQGWKPNWKDDKEIKYCIERVENYITKETYELTARVLSFQSTEIRDEFLENFRDLIEKAKELI